MSEAGTQKASLIGGALAAVGASACCLGPLLLVALGMSGAWIGNLMALQPYRPVFIGAAAVFLALAWWKIYRPRVTETCAAGGACALPRSNRRYRILFWLVSALVLIALTYPLVLPFFY